MRLVDKMQYVGMTDNRKCNVFVCFLYLTILFRPETVYFLALYAEIIIKNCKFAMHYYVLT